MLESSFSLKLRSVQSSDTCEHFSVVNFPRCRFVLKGP